MTEITKPKNIYPVHYSEKAKENVTNQQTRYAKRTGKKLNKKIIAGMILEVGKI